MFTRLDEGMVLIGGTGLEDRLQEQVPEIIKDFRHVGISTWMITGDKMETAENIGYSCNFFNKHTHLFRIQDYDPAAIMYKLKFTKKLVEKLKSLDQDNEANNSLDISQLQEWY